MKVAVIIPTVDGRQEHLARCITGYLQRSCVKLRLEVVPNQATCGRAWQLGVERALQWEPDYIHLTADDIIPGFDWLQPMVDAVEANCIPAGLVCEPDSGEILHPETGMPLTGNPVRGNVHYYEGDSGPDSIVDGALAGEMQYAAVPFCSRAQWEHIGPMIASHYGTDKWFSRRARQAGYGVKACRSSVFYHLVAHEGRIPPYEGWMHTDLIDFDLNIAYPEYVSGAIAPTDQHPAFGTREGRQLAREWRVRNVPAPHPWELEPDPQYH